MLFQNLESYPKISIPKGVMVFTEGDICDGIPYILKGEIRVTKIGRNGRELTLYHVKQNETCVLATTSVLSNTTYPANAIVDEDVEALLIPIQDFKNEMIYNNELQKFVYNTILNRYLEVITFVDEVILHSIDERVLKYLLKNSTQNHDIIKITHDRLASELGSVREVISRILKEFEQIGAISLARGKIIIINRGIIEQKMKLLD